MSFHRRLSLLISPTAFKGTLTPMQAATVMASALRKKQAPAAIRVLPVADGGDGTLEVLMHALRARRRKTAVTGPLGEKVRAEWALASQGPFSSGKTAVIEMARASGLALIKGKNRILHATSEGTGELIKAALKEGCRTIVIGVGGTATGEGGAGALRALGLRYKDEKGKELSANPGGLLKLASIDWTHLDKRLKRTRIYVMCDVTNPLLGPRGSARTFGPQKGATFSQVKMLERAMRRWSAFARYQTKDKPGSGAAGALAYGLSAFLGAKLVKGSPFIFKMINWRKAAAQADVIVTGEGRIDKTSFSGKAIGEIIRHKGRAKVIAVCGSTSLSKTELRRRGLTDVREMGPAGLTNPRRALRNAIPGVIK